MKPLQLTAGIGSGGDAESDTEPATGQALNSSMTTSDPTPSATSCFLIAVSFGCAISGFLFGYDIGVIDTVLKMPRYLFIDIDTSTSL